MFCSEEKNQKTFVLAPISAGASSSLTHGDISDGKKFFGSFFKKDLLPTLSETIESGGPMKLVFILHIGAGLVGLISGLIAVCSAKGGFLHRKAGTVFFASMLVMAIFAGCLAVAIPGQMVNLFIAAFTAYLLATGWITVRRAANEVGLFEKIACVVGVGLCAPFALLSLQLAAGMPPVFTSAVPFKGPVLIAIFGFTSVLVVASIGDARVVFGHGISGAPRIARHLWRMCLALTLAAGSAFTNGLPRLLPGPMDVTPIFFVPQLLVLCVLIFWMIRVRFTKWFRPDRIGKAPIFIGDNTNPR